MILYTILIVALSIIFFCLTDCRREQNQQTPSNVTLYDKPLWVIQSYIQGKWKLQYIEGGLAYRKIYIDTANESINLSPSQILFLKNNILLLDTSLTWSYANYVNAYVMNWSDRTGTSYFREAEEIRNDTLILYDTYADGYFYGYIRSN